MSNAQPQGFDDLRSTLNECLRIIRLRWRMALLGLTLVGALAFWYSQFLPREYSATTLFERRDDAVIQNLVTANSPYSFEHLKTTLALDMTGSRALARACARAGLLAGDYEADGALSEFERRALDDVQLRYGLKPGAHLLQSSTSLDTIQLQCSANHPQVARQVVTALRDNYIAQTRERIAQILVRTRDFFQKESSRLQDHVAETQARLRSGFEAYPGLDPTDAQALGNRLETLNMQRSSAVQRIAELEAQITAREQFLISAAALYSEQAGLPVAAPTAQPARTLVVDPAIEKSMSAIRARLLELVTAKRMTHEHPEVKRLTDQLEAMENLRETLATEPPEEIRAATPPVSPLSDLQRDWQAQKLRVDLELEALRGQLGVNQRQLADLEERLVPLTAAYDKVLDQGEQIRRLDEQRTALLTEQGEWQGHLAKIERVLSAEAGERGTRFTVIEEPKDSVLPIKPRLGAMFVVCWGLGLAAAALLVALAELFDRSFHSVGQVTRSLGIPVLECISVIATPRERRRRLLRRVVWTPVLSVLVIALLATATLAYTSLAQPALYHQALDRAGQLLGAQPPTAADEAV